MNTDTNIVVALPLPRQFVARNWLEYRRKVKALRLYHKDFMVTPYEQNDSTVKAIIYGDR